MLISAGAVSPLVPSSGPHSIFLQAPRSVHVRCALGLALPQGPNVSEASVFLLPPPLNRSSFRVHDRDAQAVGLCSDFLCHSTITCAFPFIVSHGCPQDVFQHALVSARWFPGMRGCVVRV